MEEILFSGAGGSGYTKKSSVTGGNVKPTEGGKGRVTPPSTRVRPKVQPVEPTAPRLRKPRTQPVVEAEPNEGRGGEGQQNAGNFVRRTTSRRGLAGRSGRRLRRAE